MKDFERIAALLEMPRSSPESAALATLVHVEGSSYRRPGARLLITESGRTAGGISAGCLEADVTLHAMTVLQTGKPMCVTYDAAADSDLLLGLGMGCGGTLRIVIEPTLTHGARSPHPQPLSRGGRGVSNDVGKTNRPGRDPGTCSCADGESQEISSQEAVAGSLVDWLLECGQPRQAAVASAVVHDGNEALIGTRAWLFADGRFAHDVDDTEIAKVLEADVRLATREGRSVSRDVATSDGVIRVFIDVEPPPPHLLICGAGDDSQPLYRMARELGWRVGVVDIRAAYVTRERFPEAVVARMSSYEQVLESWPVTPNTAVVVMTHNYNHDLALLRQLLPAGAAYIGLLGARHRSAKLLEELRTSGDVDDATDMSILHTPAGLDIGAATPEAIALSIIAEIQAVVSGRVLTRQS